MLQEDTRPDGEGIPRRPQGMEKTLKPKSNTMRRIERLWSMLALIGMFYAGGSQAQAQAMPKLPPTVHDTVFHENFENKAYDHWLIVDADNDGRVWVAGGDEPYGSGVKFSRALGYSMGLDATSPDDWAISELFPLETGRTYRLSFFYNQVYYDQRVEVYLGRERETNAMSQRIVRQDIPDNGWSTTVFRVEESGNYCLGIKNVSDGYKSASVFIDEISIVEDIADDLPLPVQSLKQIPGKNGSLSMGLQWTNPSQTEGGSPLSAITAIEIYKNLGNQSETYAGSLTPGAAGSWTDPDPQPGKVTYTVYAVTASGRSQEATVHTFIGEDLPSAPATLHVQVDAETATLSWDEPGEFGLNGGWYDKNGITYLVARRGQSYQVLETAATEREYTDKTTLDMYYYEVTAQNSFGQGGKIVSSPTTVGTTMTLPFHEDFEDPATLEHLWSIEDVDGDKATWYIDPARGNTRPKAAQWNYLPAIDPLNDDPTPYSDDWLFSPLLHFEQGKTYRLSYSVAGPNFGSINLRVALGKTASPTAMTRPIESLSGHATSGASSYENRVIEFESPGSGNLCIGFYYYDVAGYCWIDDILLEEVAKNDLAVNTIRGTSAPKAGKTYTYTVEVENKGTSAAREFHLQLIDQAGNVLAEGGKISRPLASGRTSEYTIDWTPSGTDFSSLQARVVYAEDEVAGNNTSPLLVLNMQGDGEEAVSIGNRELLSNLLPWSIYTSGFGQTVYPADLMEGVTGKLYGLSYPLIAGFSSGKDTLRNQKFRLYVGETDRTDMMAGWFGPDELECVLDTAMDIVPGIYDWYLPFSHPYDYKGGNLVVCVEGHNDYDNLGDFGMYFYCTESGWNAASRSINTTSTVNMQNIDNSVGTFSSLRPDITFFFDVRGTGSLSGTVSDATGTALENVQVSIAGMNASQQTSSQGRYEFPYLPAGRQHVVFHKAGFEDIEKEAAIQEGQTQALDVVMSTQPLVSVSGVVAGRNHHEGIAGAELTLTGAVQYEAVTDENGCFIIENVYGKQNYEVTVSATGYNNYAGSISVESSDTQADTIFMEQMVNMPSKVMAYDRTDHALVEWEDPVPTTWLQKDNGKIYGSFGGSTSAGYTVAHRYTPADFEAEGITEASAVTKVRFFPMAVAEFTLQIFAGEEGVESLVYEEPMEVEEYETWFEHALENPVHINPDMCLIVGISVQQSPGSNPIGFDRGPAVENGDLFSENDGLTWMTANEIAPSMDYNWIIRTYCSADPNSKPTELADLMSVRPDHGHPIPNLTGLYACKETASTSRNSITADETVKKASASCQFEILSRAERKALASKAGEANLAGTEYSYEVYRLLNGQEQQQELWTKITGSPVTERLVRDEGWETLEDTMYRYAVRSVVDEVYSDYTFSDAVDKGKYATVRLQVTTNADISAQGAQVVLEGINKTHTATVETDGTATLSDIHFGTYKLSVSLDGFRAYTASEISINENTIDLGSITLTEDVRPPKDFTATDWIDYVGLSWNKPERLIETELSKTRSEYSTGYGNSLGGDMIIGQRFTPDELHAAGVDGYYIRTISFWPDDASADFTVKVWKSDNEGQEKEFYSQAVSPDEITIGQWNTIELDEPVLINANQYYIIGYSANMPSGVYPCAVDQGPMQEGGDLIFVMETWTSFCSATSAYDFNWMISAIAANDANTSLKTLSKPEEEFNYTYELYRFAKADSADASAWTRVNGEDFKELSFKDEAWEPLPDAVYYYAVYSRSEAGNTSDTVLSAMLPKGQVSLVTVSATTNNGASASGASVKLVSEGNTYDGTLGEDATVQIPAVLKGSYELHVNKFGFDELVKTVTIEDEPQTLSGNELKESLSAPASVRAIKDENEQVRVDWWSAMTTENYPHYISWSSDEFFTGIRQEGAFNFSAAHKYTVADLEEQKAAGLYVTRIKFYPASTSSAPSQATFSIGIWSGEEGQQVYKQSVPASAIRYNEWCEVELNTPYYIDGSKTVTSVTPASPPKAGSAASTRGRLSVARAT